MSHPNPTLEYIDDLPYDTLKDDQAEETYEDKLRSQAYVEEVTKYALYNFVGLAKELQGEKCVCCGQFIPSAKRSFKASDGINCGQCYYGYCDKIINHKKNDRVESRKI